MSSEICTTDVIFKFFDEDFFSNDSPDDEEDLLRMFREKMGMYKKYIFSDTYDYFIDQYGRKHGKERVLVAGGEIEAHNYYYNGDKYLTMLYDRRGCLYRISTFSGGKRHGYTVEFFCPYFFVKKYHFGVPLFRITQNPKTNPFPSTNFIIEVFNHSNVCIYSKSYVFNTFVHASKTLDFLNLNINLDSMLKKIFILKGL